MLVRPPRRSTRCSSTTRSSFACASGDRSPTSSRNSVPWLASSMRPGLAFVGAGERAAFVPEDLRFEQRVGQRRAVDRLERLVLAAAQFVDDPGDDFLARAGRAEHQHRRGRSWRPCAPTRRRASSSRRARSSRGTAGWTATVPRRTRQACPPGSPRAASPSQGRRTGRTDRAPGAPGIARTTPALTSSRRQLSTSTLMRPNVCISVPTSNGSRGPATPGSAAARPEAATGRGS